MISIIAYIFAAIIFLPFWGIKKFEEGKKFNDPGKQLLGAIMFIGGIILLAIVFN